MARSEKILKQENEKALKHLFDQKLLQRISKSISEIDPAFDAKAFNSLASKLNSLEMKQRVHLLRDELRRLLPQDYEKALKILLQSTKGGNLKGFDLWPYTEFVQTYGIDKVELSLDALREMTVLFTSEWAVRPFLRRHPKVTLKYLKRCSQDQNVHIRRWASEGTRPRLPWGERLHDFIQDPSLTLPILEQLKFDSELYVRKSISNHLNDIAKDHPDLVVKILTDWKAMAGENHADKIEWVVHRSLRTLIKSGHVGALKLIGVSPKVKIKFSSFKVDRKKIKVGERVDFHFEIQSLSNKSQKLVVDYIVHFAKANKSASPKVFKLKTVELSPGSVLRFSKSHHFKKITTREYYSGPHLLEIQINGAVAGTQKWQLEA